MAPFHEFFFDTEDLTIIPPKLPILQEYISKHDTLVEHLRTAEDIISAARRIIPPNIVSANRTCP